MVKTIIPEPIEVFSKRTGLDLGAALFGSTAYVFASTVPQKVKEAARKAREVLGDLVQLCDGVADEKEILAAQTALSATKGGIVLSDGQFNIADDMTLSSIVKGQGSGSTWTYGTVLKLATTKTITVGMEGNLQEARVTVPSGYTGNAVVVEGGNGFRDRTNLLAGLHILNEANGTVNTGTALLIRAISTSTNMYVTLCHFGAIAITGFDYQLSIYASETSNAGYVNGNVFDSLILEYGNYPITLEDAGGGQVMGNIFQSVEIEPSTATPATTVNGIWLKGIVAYNMFPSVKIWDWEYATGTGYAVNTVSGTYRNVVVGQFHGSVLDAGNNLITDIGAQGSGSWADQKTFTNLLQNGDFEVGDPPVGWTLNQDGTTAAMERSTTQVKLGSYSLKLTNELNKYAFASQSIADYARYKGKKVTQGAWVWADTASRVRLELYDSEGYTAGSYHTGGSSWEWLTVTRLIDSSATSITAWALEIVTGSVISAYSDGAILVEGSLCPAFTPKPDDFLISHHTAAYTISAYESGQVLHTNLGAGGAVTLTLPQTVTAGFVCRFAVMVAQELRIDPGAAGAIYILAAKQTDNKYITANAMAESIVLTADGNGDWIASSVVGTWGVEA